MKPTDSHAQNATRHRPFRRRHRPQSSADLARTIAHFYAAGYAPVAIRQASGRPGWWLSDRRQLFLAGDGTVWTDRRMLRGGVSATLVGVGAIFLVAGMLGWGLGAWALAGVVRLNPNLAGGGRPVGGAELARHRDVLLDAAAGIERRVSRQTGVRASLP